MFTPMDLHKVEFKRGFRGYSEEEVDKFLDTLIADYETLYRENLELKEQLNKEQTNVNRYLELENTLKNTLVMAEKTAEQVVAQAKKEADLLLRETEQAASNMVNKAKTDAQVVRSQYQDLLKEAQGFKTKYKALLQAQMEVVDQLLVEEQPVSLESPTIVMPVVTEQ